MLCTMSWHAGSLCFCQAVLAKMDVHNSGGGGATVTNDNRVYFKLLPHTISCTDG